MADPVIKSTIPLVDAMGVVKGMTLQAMSNQWLHWSAKYPKEKDKLNPGLVALLDVMAVIANVVEIVQNVLKNLNTVLATLQDTYNAAMSVVPGVGSANAAKLVAEKAKQILSIEVLDKVFKKLLTFPQTIYNALKSSVEVDEGAIL